MKRHRHNIKGFTLVEMLVVIAIIGVLAAILIPTLIGYVLRSRVASANSIASELRKNINYFFTQADVDGYGMLSSDDIICDPEITVIDGEWKVFFTDEANVDNLFKKKGIYQWTGSGSAKFGDEKTSVTTNDELFALTLANLFPEFTNGYIKFHLSGGKCSVLYSTQELTTEVTELPEFTDSGWEQDTYNWDFSNQGVTRDGYIVGTSPILYLS